MIYDYKVLSIARVVDGDTLDAVIDVGFRMATTQRLRLITVDTPERGQDGYHEAGQFLSDWLWNNYPLRVTTYKADSFGRYLADIYCVDGESASAALLEAGWGRYVP